MDEKLAFVVRCATSVDPAFFLHRLKRIRVPAVFHEGGHDVVVAIDEHGRLVGTGAQPFTVDDRMPGRRQDLSLFDARRPQPGDQPFGHARHIAGMSRIGAHAGDAQHLVKFLAESRGVYAGIVPGCVTNFGHNSPPMM